MIAASNVSARIGRRQILDGVDLVARAGEVTVIVGPNGSGKSTLIRCLSGELAHEGRISMNGDAITGLAGWQMAAQRAVMAQSTTLVFPFTVREVVELGLQAGLAAARPEVTGLALREVGLEGYEDRLCQNLSGGEQQRVHLARALAQVWDPVPEGVPRWLLLDEPVSSLDIGHQLAVIGTARDYANRGGGVLAVMHDLNLTALFANRLLLLDQGRVAACGTPDEVLREDVLSSVYRCRLRPNTLPSGQVPYLLPQAAG